MICYNLPLAMVAASGCTLLRNLKWRRFVADLACRDEMAIQVSSWLYAAGVRRHHLSGSGVGVSMTHYGPCSPEWHLPPRTKPRTKDEGTA